MEGKDESLEVLDAWTSMKTRELSSPDLSDEERCFLKFSTADDVVSELQRLDAEQADSSRGRQYLQRLQPLTRFLEKFGQALDLFAQADAHGVLSLVWGSLRVVLVVSSHGK